MVTYQEFTYNGDDISIDITGYSYTDLAISRNTAIVDLGSYYISEDPNKITITFPGTADLDVVIRVYMGYNLSKLLNINSTYVYKIKGA